MAIINVNNLTFGYDGSYDNVFEDVCFSIDSNWKLGFIGRNGSGKTTFLNLLLGNYEFSGSISSTVDFEYFPFRIADKSENTIEAVNEICADYPYWKLVCELNLLEVSEDALYRPFGTLSNGEQTKVMLAALFLKESGFLLIDEPTNHLDANGREIVAKYLKGKKSFILVSHDRAFLDGCVDHIMSINRNDIEIQQGNYSSWMINKERKDSFELAENEKLKKEIERLDASSKEKANWSENVEKTKYATKNSGLRPDRGYIGHKAAKMMKSSKAIEKRQSEAVGQKTKLLKNLEKTEALKINQPEYRKTRLITLTGVAVVYGDKRVCQDVNLCVERGDRIALAGKNGSGKSSILKLICGENVPYTGVFEKGSGLKISYVSQDTSFLRGNLSAFAVENEIDESLFKVILRKLDFARVQFEKDISEYSAGQKKKVLIAKSLCQNAHLLVWDEPLNYIDLISRTQIENLLLEFKPTVLFVEHDRVFRDKIAAKTVYL